MRMSFFISMVLFLLASCGGRENKPIENNVTPQVSNNGQTISFPDTSTVAFFKTEIVSTKSLVADLVAPGKISATVLSSGSGAAQNIVLFENPDLAGNYTQLIQHQINISQIQSISIKQKQTELIRVTDLQQHGAATGQELLNAEAAVSIEQTNLANEKAAVIEHETKLKAGGFDPALLKKAQAGMAYIICDIPENQIGKMVRQGTCGISFTAFPNEQFTGKVDDIADMVDNATRMVKVRIVVNNASSKLKAGMFANVSFGLKENDKISVSKSCVVTVQGKTYAFVKINNNTFQRVEIESGEQIGDRIVVYNGLKVGDEIASDGVIQLKGLSFGY